MNRHMSLIPSTFCATYACILADHCTFFIWPLLLKGWVGPLSSGLVSIYPLYGKMEVGKRSSNWATKAPLSKMFARESDMKETGMGITS